MIQQPDSLHAAPSSHSESVPVMEPMAEPKAAAEVIEAAPEEAPRHPYEVLRELPEGATQVQQDSAIQSVYQPRKRIDSLAIDTMAKPEKQGKTKEDAFSLPLYYKENYFSNDSLLHPEIAAGRPGMAGVPVPYTVARDDVITGLFLCSLVLLCLAFSSLRRFFVRQTKNFFTEHLSTLTSEVTETATEVRFQLLLVVLACLLWAVSAFFYAQETVPEGFILRSTYTLIWIFFGCILAYFLLKALLYMIVNPTFFDADSNRKWEKTLLFLTAAEGVLMFPMVLLQTYFGLSLHAAIIYSIVVVAVIKILTFYKAFVIFFRKRAFHLQIILYLCALEIVPLLFLWGFLRMIVENLRIKF